jgi:hypothetical protein
MEKMKQAMSGVDPTGAFVFSDFTDPNQMQLFSEPNYSELERLLSTPFKGQTVSIEEVKEYVIADTSFYKYKAEALKPMEATSKIEIISADPKRRKGTYAEEKTRIRFL